MIQTFLLFLILLISPSCKPVDRTIGQELTEQGKGITPGSSETDPNLQDSAANHKELKRHVNLQPVDSQGNKSIPTTSVTKIEIKHKMNDSGKSSVPPDRVIDEISKSRIDGSSDVLRSDSSTREKNQGPSGEESEDPENDKEIATVSELSESVFVQQKMLHEKWGKLLQEYVSDDGKVNYPGLQKNVQSLDQYLRELQAAVPGRSDRSNTAKAFWINAYNAFTIKLILNNYPVSSIMDISKGKPWDIKWIQLGNEMLSLNNIEHDILRPVWKDARIHFAVNCAAKSCPPLANRAFTENNIEQLLMKLTSEFINNAQFNQISSSKMTLSKIFQWYQDDFGNIIDFIDEYSTVDIEPSVRIAYNEYNWTLNSI